MAYRPNILWMHDKQKWINACSFNLSTFFFSYPPLQETVEEEADVGFEVSLPLADCLCGSEHRWGPQCDSLRWAGDAVHHRWGLSRLAETSNTCMWAFLAIRWCEGALSLNPAHPFTHLISCLATPTVSSVSPGCYWVSHPISTPFSLHFVIDLLCVQIMFGFRSSVVVCKSQYANSCPSLAQNAAVISFCPSVLGNKPYVMWHSFSFLAL